MFSCYHALFSLAEYVNTLVTLLDHQNNNWFSFSSYSYDIAAELKCPINCNWNLYEDDNVSVEVFLNIISCLSAILVKIVLTNCKLMGN